MTEWPQTKVYSDESIAQLIAQKLARAKGAPYHVVPCPAGYHVLREGAEPTVMGIDLAQGSDQTAVVVMPAPNFMIQADTAEKIMSKFKLLEGLSGKSVLQEFSGEKMVTFTAKLMGQSKLFFNVWVPEWKPKGAQGYAAKVRYISKSKVLEHEVFSDKNGASLIIATVKLDTLLKNKMYGLLPEGVQ